MPTTIMFCSCNHAGQDELHGEHQRVHNTGGTETRPIARCTVCESVREFKPRKGQEDRC